MHFNRENIKQHTFYLTQGQERLHHKNNKNFFQQQCEKPLASLFHFTQQHTKNRLRIPRKEL